MLNTMSKTENMKFTPSIAIHKIWDVQANSAYSAKKHLIRSDALVAIRTADGCGSLELADGSFFELKTNSLIIIKLADVKRYFTKKDRWNFKWLEFYADEDVIPKLNTVYDIVYTDYEIYHIQNCFYLLNSQNPGASLAASAVFSSVLLLWHHTILSVNNGAYTNILEKVIGYINSNINSHLSVCGIADRFNMSERTFRNTFTKYKGVSPKQYIEQKRLDIAMEFLNSFHIQIKEISALAGFSNPYYFSRAFKKRFGHPPSFYLKK